MRTKRVLIIDDNEAVRGVVIRILNSAGYAAFGTGTAEDALGVIHSAPEMFDLLIVNQRLPGMAGDELVRQVWVERPTQAMIRILGNVDDAEVYPLPPECRTVPKPFLSDTLTAAVRDAIGPAVEPDSPARTG